MESLCNINTDINTNRYATAYTWKMHYTHSLKSCNL